MRWSGAVCRITLDGTRTPRESLAAAAAAVLGEQAEVGLSGGGPSLTVMLRFAAKVPAARRRALAGEFLNEALSHLYRQLALKAERELAQAALSRLFARGFPPTPPDPLEELEPQVRADRAAEAQALLAQARELERSGG